MSLGKYEPKKIETKWAEKWVDDKTYKWTEAEEPENNYLIDSPPPYPYVNLHAGNFLNSTYQDIMARYKRMKGFHVLHPWGWDCHGLGAEIYIQKHHNVYAEDVGVNKFRQFCKEHITKNINNIRTTQAMPLGMSIDWSKQYKTMSEDYMKIVQESFINMKDKKLIYREEYPVTWCPSCHSAIAEAQMDRIEREGKLHYVKLPLVEQGSITIATTRPELMPACVAVFINPNDERYKSLIGKKVKIPFTNQIVEILSNEEVDSEFGTGIVYHCTFGDKDDWKWVYDYNLPIRVVIDESGKFTKDAGILKGLTIEQGRKKIIQELNKKGLYEKSESSPQSIKVCERCKTPIEIIVKKQWYFATTKLKKEIIKAAEDMNWYPDYMLKRLKDWVDNASWDWVISRQRYWATPFPVWYCEDCDKIIFADKNELPVDPIKVEKKCPECGGRTVPETDVMDTWMDSSLTALYVSKWLKNQRKDRLCDLRDQGEDIIKTWIYYSMTRCISETGKKPFKDVLINGMLLGLDGKKMSKRRSEAAVYPEEIIEKYSADAYRQWAGNSTPGDDVQLDWKEIEYGHKFLNKLWNLANFTSMFETEEKEVKLEVSDEIILNELNKTINKVTKHMDDCNWGNALKTIREFTWHEFADYYVEEVKYRLYSDNESSKASAVKTLRKVLLSVLKMLSPFTPFITEELYNELYNSDKSIHLQAWPKQGKVKKEILEQGKLMKEVISELRQYKINNKMSMSAELEKVIITSPDDLKEIEDVIKGTIRIKELEVKKGKELKISVN